MEGRGGWTDDTKEGGGMVCTGRWRQVDQGGSLNFPAGGQDERQPGRSGSGEV